MKTKKAKKIIILVALFLMFSALKNSYSFELVLPGSNTLARQLLKTVESRLIIPTGQTGIPTLLEAWGRVSMVALMGFSGQYTRLPWESGTINVGKELKTARADLSTFDRELNIGLYRHYPNGIITLDQIVSDEAKLARKLIKSGAKASGTEGGIINFVIFMQTSLDLTSGVINSNPNQYYGFETLYLYIISFTKMIDAITSASGEDFLTTGIFPNVVRKIGELNGLITQSENPIKTADGYLGTKGFVTKLFASTNDFATALDRLLLLHLKLLQEGEKNMLHVYHDELDQIVQALIQFKMEFNLIPKGNKNIITAVTVDEYLDHLSNMKVILPKILVPKGEKVGQFF